MFKKKTSQKLENSSSKITLRISQKKQPLGTTEYHEAETPGSQESGNENPGQYGNASSPQTPGRVIIDKILMDQAHFTINVMVDLSIFFSFFLHLENDERRFFDS